MTNKEKLQELEDRIKRIEEILNSNRIFMEFREKNCYDLNEVGGMIKYRNRR